MRGRIALTVIAVGLALSLTACGTEAGAAGPSGAADAGIKLAVVTSNSASPWNATYAEAFEDAAHAYGVTDVKVIDGQGDPQKQLTEIQQALNQGYKGISVNAMPGLSLRQLASLFEQNDAYYVNTNGNDDWQTTYESPSNVAYASYDVRDATSQLIDLLADKLGGEGEFAAIASDTVKDFWYNQVWHGVEDGIAENPGLKLVDRLDSEWTAESGQSKTADLIAKHPDLKALYISDGATAQGAVAAIRAAGKVPGKDVIIVSTGDESDLSARIESGEVLAAGAQPSAQLGYFFASRLFDKLNGVDPDPGLEQLWIETPILTQDNVGQYLERYDRPVDEQFDAVKFSKFLSPDDWDLQGEYTVVDDLESLYPDIEQPAGYEVPAEFTELKDSGAFEKAAELLEQHDVTPLF